MLSNTFNKMPASIRKESSTNSNGGAAGEIRNEEEEEEQQVRMSEDVRKRANSEKVVKNDHGNRKIEMNLNLI